MISVKCGSMLPSVLKTFTSLSKSLIQCLIILCMLLLLENKHKETARAQGLSATECLQILELQTSECSLTQKEEALSSAVLSVCVLLGTSLASEDCYVIQGISGVRQNCIQIPALSDPDLFLFLSLSILHSNTWVVRPTLRVTERNVTMCVSQGAMCV